MDMIFFYLLLHKNAVQSNLLLNLAFRRNIEETFGIWQ